MSKERENSRIIQLRVEDIFMCPDNRYDVSLTPAGARFVGIKSIKDYLSSDSKEVKEMSNEMRKEWDVTIDNKFREIGEILDIEIPSDEKVRDGLIEQTDVIIQGRREFKLQSMRQDLEVAIIT